MSVRGGDGASLIIIFFSIMAMLVSKNNQGYEIWVLYINKGHQKLEPTGTQTSFQGNQLELKATGLPPK